MKNPTYYNGVICPFENASIPLSDRSIFFADAVYDVMIGRSKTPYQFAEHIARLRQNCKEIGLTIPYTDSDLSEIAGELVELSEYDEYMLYIQLSGHSLTRKHKRDSAAVNLLMTVTDISIPKAPNEVKAILLPDTRYEYCNLKTTNLLPSVLSMNQAAEVLADIAIFHRDGFVTEASYANVFIYKDNKLITPPLDNHLLPGITRDNILKISGTIGIEVSKKAITKDELFTADAVLLSSTTKLLQICTRIDGVNVSPLKTIAKELFDLLYADFCGT